MQTEGRGGSQYNCDLIYYFVFLFHVCLWKIENATDFNRQVAIVK